MLDHGLEDAVLESVKKADSDARKLPGSGSLHAQEDIITHKFLIQCKETKSDSIRIQATDLDRLCINAEKFELDPIFVIRINATSSKNQVYVYTVNKSYIKKSVIARPDNMKLAPYAFYLTYIGDIDSLTRLNKR